VSSMLASGVWPTAKTRHMALRGISSDSDDEGADDNTAIHSPRGGGGGGRGGEGISSDSGDGEGADDNTAIHSPRGGGGGGRGGEVEEDEVAVPPEAPVRSAAPRWGKGGRGIEPEAAPELPGAAVRPQPQPAPSALVSVSSSSSPMAEVVSGRGRPLLAAPVAPPLRSPALPLQRTLTNSARTTSVASISARKNARAAEVQRRLNYLEAAETALRRQLDEALAQNQQLRERLTRLDVLEAQLDELHVLEEENQAVRPLQIRTCIHVNTHDGTRGDASSRCEPAGLYLFVLSVCTVCCGQASAALLADMTQMENDLEQSRASCRALEHQLQRTQRAHDATVGDRRRALGLVADTGKQTATLRKELSDLRAQVKLLQDEAEVAAEEVRVDVLLYDSSPTKA
jgi:hypothetical protein